MWSVVHLRCICIASAVRLRVVVVIKDIVKDVICGTPAVRLQCARSTPAVRRRHPYCEPMV